MNSIRKSTGVCKLIMMMNRNFQSTLECLSLRFLTIISFVMSLPLCRLLYDRNLSLAGIIRPTRTTIAYMRLISRVKFKGWNAN